MKLILFTGWFLGAALAALMMFIAINHDPQGAVSSDLGWLFTIGFS